MAKITFNIPDEYLPRIITAIEGLYPIPKIADPDFVVDKDNPALQAEMVDEFTSAGWAKERVRRFMLDTVRRYERKEAIDTAKESISVNDNLIN